MLLAIVSFLGSCVYAADVEMSAYYPGLECSGSPIAQVSIDEFPTCTAYHSYLVQRCLDAGHQDDCNLPDFPMCLGSDIAWIYENYGITTKFSCIDVTDPPIALPTELCFDNILNGDEEGVDCGGSCSLQCPSTCNTLEDCGESHYLKDDPEDIECATHECNIGDDLDTCCIARALCSTLLSCFAQVLISAADTTYCEMDSCRYFSDGERCCADAPSCAGFELCDPETQYLKDSAENLYCSSEQCGPADTEKCCANKETCDQYTCSYADGLVNVQNDESIYYRTDDPGVVSTCCENRASCVGFMCDDTMFLDKSDKDTKLCPEATCTSNAWVTCCDMKQVCLEPGLQAYTCSPSAEYPLSPNAESLYCNGTTCESPRDDAFCCINTPAPAEPTYAEEGEPCEGFDEETEEPFPSCANGLVCKPNAEISIPGAGNTCVNAEKTYAEEGEPCEGFDERTAEPFPSCANGLVCKRTAEISIPGAENTCVKDISPTPEPVSPVETPTPETPAPKPVTPVETPTPKPVTPVETPTLEPVPPIATPSPEAVGTETTPEPTESPTSIPSQMPVQPTSSPTTSPSSIPSLLPTTIPTITPTQSPTNDDCSPYDDWSQARADELCGTSHHTYGVGLCTKYDNPDYQRRLEFALANELFGNCYHTCVYDYETYSSTMPVAFKWVGSCYNVQIGKWSCIDDEIVMEHAHEHAATLCEPSEPCIDRVDWTSAVAESNCPAAEGYGGRDKGYGSAKVCNKLVRQWDGFYETADDLYGASFNASLANHLFWGCDAKCLYDVEEIGVVYQWKGEDCWEMQTNWACITTHVNEYAWAMDYINEDICPIATPAPVTYACVEREQDWDETIASNICASEYMGLTDRSENAVVCAGFEDHQYRLDHSLANRAFLSCEAWCVYDIYKRGYEGFIWRNSDQCWKPVSTGLCIGGNPRFREQMTDYIDNTLCASTTPEPTEAPTCRTQYEWSEDVMDDHCTVAETKVTYKHYSSIGRAAVPCEDVDSNEADLLKSMAMALFNDCSSWCVYDFYARAHDAWKWNNGDKCWDRVLWKDWGSCFWNWQQGDISTEYMAAMEAIALTCTYEPTVSPTDCMPEYTWNEDRAAEVCPSIQTADKSFGVQVCTDANSASKQTELEKSLANQFFTKCDSWCVYDYDTVMDNVQADPNTNNFGGFIWRNNDKCWKWVTCCLCFDASINEFVEVTESAKEMCVVQNQE